jgi:hypothetical protein
MARRFAWLPVALGDPSRPDLRCRRQYQAELFAAEPGDVVDHADSVVKETGSRRQSAVPLLVAVLIVVDLEIIDIDHDQQLTAG